MTRDEKPALAKESEKTQKTRAKLKKRLESIDRSMTQQALKRKVIEIQRWISRNAPDRVSLKNKGIALFDSNQHAAEVSARVRKLTNAIQTDLQHAEASSSITQKSELPS